MSPLAALSIAWGGVYAFVGGYYGLQQVLRSRPEHGRFAAFCACYAVYAFATALRMEAPSPAASVVWQQLQDVALMTGVVCFLELALALVEEVRPGLVRAARAWAWVASGAALAGLFYDPARADPRYPWDLGGVAQGAVSELRPLGLVLLLGAVLVACVGVTRLVVGARERTELRVAAAVTAVVVAGGVYDLLGQMELVPPLLLTSYLGLLPVLGFSYVLLGRFSRIDAELEARTEELAASYASLDEAQEELIATEQLAAVGELSAVIAHELRNPLAIIKNAVSGLRREPGPEDEETLLAILDEEGDRLNRLVSDLLAYAKPIAADVSEVDLRTLVLRAVELAAGGRRGIEPVEIELELDTEVALVEGDETLLRHALLNIVDNALEALNGEGTLTVSCRDAEMDGARPCVCVDVHDTGEGMDTLVRTRARDPFFTTRSEGTGLGLAIVDRVARAHGGTVEIESRHGQGTKVTLAIPVKRSSLAPPES